MYCICIRAAALQQQQNDCGDMFQSYKYNAQPYRFIKQKTN